MRITTWLAQGAWLLLGPSAAMATEPVVERCAEPMSVLHLRSDGLPLRDERTLCAAQGEFSLFSALDLHLSADAPMASYMLTADGAEVTLVLPGHPPMKVSLASNQAEQIVGMFPADQPLRVRLEQKPWPADPLQRWLRVTAINVPVRSLVQRIAHALDLHIDGEEHLCAEPVTFHFQVGIPAGSLLALAAEECAVHWQPSSDGSIRLAKVGEALPLEPPASPQDELVVETQAALMQATSPRARERLLTHAAAQLAMIDPDRIGPAWLQLALVTANHAPPAERADALTRAIDLHAHLLPRYHHERAEHERSAAALHSERADALLAQGQRAQALADLEYALDLLAFEPGILRRAAGLVDDDEAVTWWQRQLERTDAARTAWFTGDSPEHRHIDEDRYRAIRTQAAHAITADHVHAERWQDALETWAEIAIARAIGLGDEHPRTRAAAHEARLLSKLSLDPLALYPADAPIPSPPLAMVRQGSEAATGLGDDIDLFDAALAQRIADRHDDATDPVERARLAVLVAEVGLLREGIAALDAALDRYRSAEQSCRADQCREGSFTKQLLDQRIAFLEGLREATD